MQKKVLPLSLAAVTIILLLAAQTVFAGPSIDEVKNNVVNLWKPIKESQPHVTAVEFKKILDSDKDLILIDVRTADEYKAAHIPGAIHIPRGVMEWVTPRTIENTDIPIYTYCRTGARSAFAAQRLTDMGYTNVTNIYDAFKGWLEAGYSVYNRHGEFVMSKGGFEKQE
ncbi:Rhodanese-related sulfurtransferase [Desulfuromusa kysingii]|uniref:Rhodanese-related sulfurtransferase n=1 Tax=Desulfuromusa kysingii TaxID=37625 RepID=A0A1H3XNI0_9BACT|nr:rhodanese-like domain-containing protein [Desulfuromusa kysingii]SEA00906.1 Rhodanese-related sulfurtransferase [Desulfuromusa kysingii]